MGDSRMPLNLGTPQYCHRGGKAGLSDPSGGTSLPPEHYWGSVIRSIPTPVTKTQALGGCGALAMAPAIIWVVSRRLLRTSFWKASFHLH